MLTTCWLPEVISDCLIRLPVTGELKVMPCRLMVPPKKFSPVWKGPNAANASRYGFVPAFATYTPPPCGSRSAFAALPARLSHDGCNPAAAVSCPPLENCRRRSPQPLQLHPDFLKEAPPTQSHFRL